ncbi:izumo sperm-egg fusion protein 3 [Rhinoderma darwinii]|uniref:izumo sperm-egg fusion protein 3 n=1 Tax=Rhinoderma darwinii TaxID=43563 RepID=UPI003F67244C
MAFWTFLFFALIFYLHPILGMLDCDPMFVKNLDHCLSSKVPNDVPNRAAFLEGLKKEILGVYQASFKDKPHLRIIDIRSVAKLKKMVFDNLRGSKFNDLQKVSKSCVSSWHLGRNRDRERNLCVLAIDNKERFLLCGLAGVIIVDMDRFVGK